jgi:hypothetical protein
MKSLINISLAFLLSIGIVSCEKVEGQGGQAAITGKVIVQKRERIQNSVIAEYDALDERVYIIYGDDETPIADDDVRTTYNGMYKFDYLHPGNYRVYVYSECQKCPQEIEPIIREIKIGKNQNNVEVEPIYITVY